MRLILGRNFSFQTKVLCCFEDLRVTGVAKALLIFVVTQIASSELHTEWDRPQLVKEPGPAKRDGNDQCRSKLRV